MKGRYSRDYRLHEYFDEKGKVHIRSEYIGEDWHFLSSEEVIQGEKQRALLRCPAAWLFYLSAMLLPGGAMHRLYIALPYAFAAVPLFMYTDFTAAFRRMREPLEHRHADRLNNRYPLILFLWTVFSMIPSVLWGLEILMGHAAGTGDYVFEVCAMALMVMGGTAFKRKDLLAAGTADGRTQDPGEGGSSQDKKGGKKV